MISICNNVLSQYLADFFVIITTETEKIMPKGTYYLGRSKRDQRGGKNESEKI